MLKEREEQLREDYDKVLASKLAGDVSFLDKAINLIINLKNFSLVGVVVMYSTFSIKNSPSLKS